MTLKHHYATDLIHRLLTRNICKLTEVVFLALFEIERL